MKRTIKDSAITIFEYIKSIGDGLDVSFDENEITLYWHNLRIDVQPKDLERALKVIVELQTLEARFE